MQVARMGCLAVLALAFLIPSQVLASKSSDSATLAQDSATISAIEDAERTKGFDAIHDRLDDLEAILKHVPQPFHQVETLDGTTYVRTTDVSQCMVVTLAAAEVIRKLGKTSRSSECLPDPYPKAALLIAAYLDEIGRWSDGLIYLDRALAFEPDYAPARAERGAALNALHRYNAAIENDREGLNSRNASLTPRAEGGLLRGEGFALTELGQLDEAEAAYRRSLKVDPQHGHARDELTYIARLKAGDKPTGVYFDSQLNPKSNGQAPQPHG